MNRQHDNSAEVERMKANILDIYGKATDAEIFRGMHWYQEANRFAQGVANSFDVPLESVVGATVAISPNCSWPVNKRDAENLVRAFRSNREYRVSLATWRKNRLKAIHILRTGKPLEYLNPKTGAKTYSFYWNILDPTNGEFVTVDRHAFGVATGIRYTPPSGNNRAPQLAGKRYQTAVLAYKEAGKELGILPNQIQAITWLVWKRLGREL